MEKLKEGVKEGQKNANHDEDEDLFDLIDDFFLIADKSTKRVSTIPITNPIIGLINFESIKRVSFNELLDK